MISGACNWMQIMSSGDFLKFKNTLDFDCGSGEGFKLSFETSSAGDVSSKLYDVTKRVDASLEQTENGSFSCVTINIR